MKPKLFGDVTTPNILIVQEDLVEKEAASSISPLLNKAYCAEYQPGNTLNWIQQNQPDLIILKLKKSEVNYLDLIISLRLDWLTRDIPILIIGNRFVLRSTANLDYDACLKTPYSMEELERAICSLIRTPACQAFA